MYVYGRSCIYTYINVQINLCICMNKFMDIKVVHINAYTNVWIQLCIYIHKCIDIDVEHTHQASQVLLPWSLYECVYVFMCICECDASHVPLHNHHMSMYICVYVNVFYVMHHT